MFLSSWSLSRMVIGKTCRIFSTISTIPFLAAASIGASSAARRTKPILLPLLNISYRWSKWLNDFSSHLCIQTYEFICKKQSWQRSFLPFFWSIHIMNNNIDLSHRFQDSFNIYVLHHVQVVCSYLTWSLTCIHKETKIWKLRRKLEMVISWSYSLPSVTEKITSNAVGTISLMNL